jgi:hypothetical protein
MQRVAMAAVFTGVLLGGQVLLTPSDMTAGSCASVLASASAGPTKSGCCSSHGGVCGCVNLGG